jgi:hypothetical protein
MQSNVSANDPKQTFHRASLGRKDDRQGRSMPSLKTFSANCAKLVEDAVRQRECGRRQILMQVRDR